MPWWCWGILAWLSVNALFVLVMLAQYVRAALAWCGEEDEEVG